MTVLFKTIILRCGIAYKLCCAGLTNDDATHPLPVSQSS